MHDHTTCFLLAGMVWMGACYKRPSASPTNSFCRLCTCAMLVVKLRFPQGRIVMIDDDFTEKLHPHLM